MPMNSGSLRAVLAAALALALMLVAVGCGGDSSDDDGAAVSEVVAASVTSQDEEMLCTELVTERFIEAVYGDLSTCLEAEAPGDDEGEVPDEVTVADIEIDGDAATATVTEVGGDSDGATGTFSLVLVDESWRIDELGIDYLRSSLEQGFATEDEFTEEEHGPLADEDVRDCLREGMAELDDETFRAIAYDGIADRDPNETFVEILTGCMSQVSGERGEVSLLRRQFEEGIRESALADNASEEEINCVLGHLRRSISEDEIIEQVGRGGDDVDPVLAQKAAMAISRC